MITFPLSLPTNKGIARIVVRQKTTVGISKSPFTGAQQTYWWPGEWWELECTLPPMKRPDAEQWLAFLGALRGQSGTFLAGDPMGASPQGITLDTPVVNGANQAGTQLATRGWAVSQSGILLPGDYLQIGPSTAVPSPRLYKVLTPMSSDSGGNCTLDIFPRLRESPADGDAITLQSPVGTFRLAENSIQWDVDAGKNYAMAFKALEAF